MREILLKNVIFKYIVPLYKGNYHTDNLVCKGNFIRKKKIYVR